MCAASYLHGVLLVALSTGATWGLIAVGGAAVFWFSADWDTDIMMAGVVVAIIAGFICAVYAVNAIT